MKDLTKGSPSKVMISFAVPVALGNIFQLCYSLADTRVVGSTLGEAALAAVGATTSISTLFIGFLSGLPGLRKVLRNRIPLIIWGMLMGMLYSGIMDIWTVLDLTGVWSWKRYLMALSTAVPYIIAYMSSNVVFLMIGLKPLGEKLNRVQTKHGIF